MPIKKFILELFEEEIYRFASRKKSDYNEGRLKGAVKLKVLFEKYFPDMDKINDITDTLLLKSGTMTGAVAKGFTKSMTDLRLVLWYVSSGIYEFEFPTNKQRWKIKEIENKLRFKFHGVSKQEASDFLKKYALSDNGSDNLPSY